MIDELARHIYDDSADPSAFFILSLAVACDPPNPLHSQELERFATTYFRRHRPAAKA